jgi:WXG100 family type VII secretion target
MSGQFRVTAADMRMLSNHMTEVNGRIQAELGRLEGLVGSIAGGWEGDAATAYRGLQTRWNEDTAKLNKLLGEFQGAITATEATYTGTENESSAAISRITAALG